jgi:HEAT repeat protein
MGTSLESRRIIWAAALMAALAGGSAAQEAAAALPAFPGAEGFGAASIGGRGGRVIKVTNLNPAGPGSFAAALAAKGPRVVVFDVSGVIPKGRGKHGGYPIAEGRLTIAGQTAPEPGIAIEGKFDCQRLSDVIVRHLRIRYTGPNGGDAVLVVNCSNFIADHVSVSWGADESFSLPGTKNATVQWTTIEESRLCWEGGDEPHNFGMIISGGPSTLNRVLFAHHHQRAPAAQYGIVLDYRNSVLYNVGGNLGIPPGGGNVVGNYLEGGPGALFGMPRIYHPPPTFTRPGLLAGRRPQTIHMRGNYLTHEGGYREPAARRGAARPIECPPVTTRVAEEAYEEVMACAGALPRDEITARCIREVRNGTGRWDEHLPGGDWRSRMAGGTPRPDADGDGMPDEWETAHKLNPKDAADAGKTVPAGASPGDRHKGYTYIEFYINELADLLDARALGAARLGTARRGQSPNPEWKELPKPLGQLVADIDMQNLQIRKTDTGATWRAIWALRDAGPKAAAAAKPLADVLDTTDNRKALFAAWALGVIGPFADEKVVVPVLVKGLVRRDYQRPVRNSKWNMNPRGFIAWALGRLGRRAKPSVPALAQTLHGEDVWARQPAAWALWQIGEDAAPATDALVQALSYGGGVGWSVKTDCRQHAARALARIGRSAVPPLIRALQGADRKKGAVARRGVAMALGLIGPEAKNAIPALVEALSDADPLVRGEAAVALSRIDPTADGVVAALSRALADSDYGVRNNVAKALGRCGPAAKPALAALKKTLRDQKKEVRWAAFEATARIGPQAAAVLIEALGDGSDAWHRKHAARALGSIGPKGRQAERVAALIIALRDSDAEVRREVVWSLALIGPAAGSAATGLQKARDSDPDYVVRHAAGEALKRIGASE